MTSKSGETHQKSAQPSDKTCAPDLQRPLTHLFHPLLLWCAPASVASRSGTEMYSSPAEMWVMWLHNFNSYRIINVEMQMKRGHPSAFVGASLLFLCLAEMVGRSGRADSSDWADRAVQKEWEDAPLCSKTRFVSLSDSVAAVDKKMKQKQFFFVLKWHLRRKSTPINSLQGG